MLKEKKKMTEIHVDGVPGAISADLSVFMANLLIPGTGCPDWHNYDDTAGSVHVAEDVTLAQVETAIAVDHWAERSEKVTAAQAAANAALGATLVTE